MGLYSWIIRYNFGKSDKKRDKGLTTPEDVERFDNLLYGMYKKWNRLDVYRPKGVTGDLPVIVIVHGGAWVYGTKEVYQFYGMSLAQHGFVVVNCNYRLAGEYKYPSGMEDINQVFRWVKGHHAEYGMDVNNIFAVGDSAGGQMLATYAAIMTNPEYAKTYPFSVPKDLQLNAIALNCGVYDVRNNCGDPKQHVGLMKEVLPNKGTEEELYWISPYLHITKDFPPCFVMTSSADFLNLQPERLLPVLEKNEVPHKYVCYGDEENLLYHVFHINVRLEDGKRCNDEECAFFREYIKER